MVRHHPKYLDAHAFEFIRALEIYPPQFLKDKHGLNPSLVQMNRPCDATPLLEGIYLLIVCAHNRTFTPQIRRLEECGPSQANLNLLPC